MGIKPLVSKHRRALVRRTVSVFPIIHRQGMIPYEILFAESHPATVLLPHHFSVFVLRVELEHLVSSLTLLPATGNSVLDICQRVNI